MGICLNLQLLSQWLYKAGQIYQQFKNYIESKY
jgi:hypothetical protein